MPVRLVFKNSQLETLAEKNLKSRVVRALLSLTVDEFISEVLGAMKAPRSMRKSLIRIGFVSKSVKFPIHFSGHDRLQNVFKKISSIEESRHSSSEDLIKTCIAAAQDANESPNPEQPVVNRASDFISAEIDLLDDKRSEGKSGGVKKTRRHRRSTDDDRKRSHSTST